MDNAIQRQFTKPIDLISKIPPAIKGLIFDLDGTLADTMPSHIEAWAMTGRHYGVEITADMVNALAGAPSMEVISVFNEQFGWDIDPGEGKKIKSEFYVYLLDQLERIEPIREVYELVHHFNGKLPMAIGTGSSHQNAERVIRALGLQDIIKVVVSADQVKNPKPHPETFLSCALQLNVEPEDCLVFEDGPMGIQAALAAGMRVLILPQYELI